MEPAQGICKVNSLDKLCHLALFIMTFRKYPNAGIHTMITFNGVMSVNLERVAQCAPPLPVIEPAVKNSGITAAMILIPIERSYVKTIPLPIRPPLWIGVVG